MVATFVGGNPNMCVLMTIHSTSCALRSWYQRYARSRYVHVHRQNLLTPNRARRSHRSSHDRARDLLARQRPSLSARVSVQVRVSLKQNGYEPVQPPCGPNDCDGLQGPLLAL